MHLKLDELQGFHKTDRPLAVEIQYPYRRTQPGTVQFGDTLTFDLGGYEEILFELRPAGENQLRIEGARYSAEKAADAWATSMRVSKRALIASSYVALAVLESKNAKRVFRTLWRTSLWPTHEGPTVMIPGRLWRARS